MVDIETTVVSSSLIDIKVHAFGGTNYQCKNEVYRFNGNLIELPNSSKPDNCVKKIYDDFGGYTLQFSYIPERNIVHVELPVGELEMRQC
jgi:hypothetical protein